MSNALHHVAPASFFPTATELSSGLQWFKEHPILAAAAATAVSVITYLHTADGEGEEVLAVVATSPSSDEDPANDPANQLQRRQYVYDAEEGEDEHGHGHNGDDHSEAEARHHHHQQQMLLQRQQPRPQPKPVAPALRKPGSDGRMSPPVAVSWVDEHGGSLTQVFEHLHVTSDANATATTTASTTATTTEPPSVPARAYPDLDSPLRRRGAAKDVDVMLLPTRVHHALPPTNPMGASHLRAPTPPLHHGARSPAGMAPLSSDAASPQWGWYVPITPPQDHAQTTETAGASSTSAVVPPRGVAQQSASVTRSSARAQDGSVGHGAGGGSLRRSTSGRIK